MADYMGQFGDYLQNQYNRSAIPGAINDVRGLFGQLQQPMMGPVPEDQMAPLNLDKPLNPKDVNYPMPQGGGGGYGMSAASAPALSPAGGNAASGPVTQYAGGIPSLLRSYGEPSIGLLRYIEG